ncbi:MAG: hypothetical protein WCB16_16510 [Candidatus Binatus sp.]
MEVIKGLFSLGASRPEALAVAMAVASAKEVLLSRGSFPMHSAAKVPRAFECLGPGVEELLGIDDGSELLRRELNADFGSFFLHSSLASI